MTQPQGGRAFRMIGGAHGMISGRAHGVISDSAHGWSAEFLTYAPVVRITSGGTAHPGTQLRPPGLQRQPVLAVPNWMTAAICSLTNAKPGSVCSDPMIARLQARLPVR